MAQSTPVRKVTHAIDAWASQGRLQASGGKNGSAVWEPDAALWGGETIASGRMSTSPRPEAGTGRAARRGGSSGSEVMSRNAGATTTGPVRRSTRRCWWNSPIESLERRSNFRRRRLGASTAAHTNPSIRRTTIVKYPSIYLPMSYDHTERNITIGGWSGTVRVVDSRVNQRRGPLSTPAAS